MSVALLVEEITGVTKTAEGVAKLVDVALLSSDIAKRVVQTSRLAEATLRQARLLLKDVQSTDPNQALDPQDELCERLLKAQQELREVIASIDDELQKRSISRWVHWLVVWTGWRRLRIKLAALHAVLGEIRTFILEHDADCSGLGPAFSSLDELFSHLDRPSSQG